MYNNITEEKIKNIPKIGDIDITKLPQELTRIYAYIVSIRHKFANSKIDFKKDQEFFNSLDLLRKLANNLETILLTIPQHEQKESIAFVAGTANMLIHKIVSKDKNILLERDSISSYIAATILFLIGNSQADATEIALSIDGDKKTIQGQLISCIIDLAKGDFTTIYNNDFNEELISKDQDFQTIALDYLWRELGLGIIDLSKRLRKQVDKTSLGHFDKVISLAISDLGIFEQKSIFAGPYRLAKLLKILEDDIFNRAVIDIPVPKGINVDKWNIFLQKIAENRPYLWENHKDAISTNFLNGGVSAILTFPTGAGKSTLSELKIASCLYSGKKVIYLVPTHALEDQTNKNLNKLFNQFKITSVEIDGQLYDTYALEDLSILVMTPEKCITFLNVHLDFTNNVGLVVFDEFHLIHGDKNKSESRAIDAMYCLISLFHMASSADYLLISAMVKNSNEISSWIEKIIGRKCEVFNSTWKPTRQLQGCLMFDKTEVIELENKLKSSLNRQKSVPESIKKQLLIKPCCLFSLKNIWDADDSSNFVKYSIIEEHVQLGANNNTWNLTTNKNVVAASFASHFYKLGLKVLVFVDRPLITSSTLKNINNILKDESNNYYHEYCDNKKMAINSISQELGDFKYSYFNHCANVVVHHGLLLPLERALIEEYYKNKEGAKILVATATLGQGINLPADIVIIAGDERFDTNRNMNEKIDAHELLNAAGRAGRAGLSSQGAVILIPSKIVAIDGDNIRKNWVDIKDLFFSKGDQCLDIEDPLEYFLDQMEQSESIDIKDDNILYKFKPSIIDDSTKQILSKSFYAYKLSQDNKLDEFEKQVQNLLDRRSELYEDSINIDDWQKQIGIKMGVSSAVIHQLVIAINIEGLDKMLSKTIVELIEWFFIWLKSNIQLLKKIFLKESTLEEIKNVTSVQKIESINLHSLDLLSNILKSYVEGCSLSELEQKITGKSIKPTGDYLVNSRKFVLRLIPDLSFTFGILSNILLKMVDEKKLEREIINDIKLLSTCIREGFNTSEKLFYKKDKKLTMRVETHIEFQKKKFI